MTRGPLLRCRQPVSPPDWIAYDLQNAVRPPGHGFAYSDPGVDLVPAILAEASGQSVLQYARNKLFTPLGVDTDPAAEPLAVPSNIDVYEAAGSRGRSTPRSPSRLDVAEAPPPRHGRFRRPPPPRGTLERRPDRVRGVGARSDVRQVPGVPRRAMGICGGSATRPMTRRPTWPGGSAVNSSRSSRNGSWSS